MWSEGLELLVLDVEHGYSWLAEIENISNPPFRLTLKTCACERLAMYRPCEGRVCRFEDGRTQWNSWIRLIGPNRTEVFAVKAGHLFFGVLSNCCLLLIWCLCLKHTIFPVFFARSMNEHKFPRWCLCDSCNTWPHGMNVTVSNGIPATGIEIFWANQQGSYFILLDFYKNPLHLQILHHYHRFCRPEEAAEYQGLLEQDPYTSMLAKHFLSCSFAFGSFFLFGSASKVSDTQLWNNFHSSLFAPLRGKPD